MDEIIIFYDNGEFMEEVVYGHIFRLDKGGSYYEIIKLKNGNEIQVKYSHFHNKPVSILLDWDEINVHKIYFNNKLFILDYKNKLEAVFLNLILILIYLLKDCMNYLRMNFKDE